ncbi:amidohydrolase family protein [Litoreibacter sp.]|nr:amidohydrolase family protein [Litoreibacter sp.]
MRIDAHQHFWSLERNDYEWLTPELTAIYRDFLPEDLTPHLREHDIGGTILVQAAPTIAETQYMLKLAAQAPFVKGVVGWVEFGHADAPHEIGRLAQHRKFVGLRPMIQDIPDPNWMLRPDLTPTFEALMAQDLTFDALTLPHHLPNLLTLLERHPNMRTVIDHGSKPLIADGIMEGWAKDMTRLASQTDAYCKLSGLVTEAALNWSLEDLKPYTNHLLDCFGPDRLIWGSDWPVCTLATSYGKWVEISSALLDGLAETEIAAIMGGNAIKAYGLKI